jgi:hypothetical protein
VVIEGKMVGGGIDASIRIRNTVTSVVLDTVPPNVQKKKKVRVLRGVFFFFFFFFFFFLKRLIHDIAICNTKAKTKAQKELCIFSDACPLYTVPNCLLYKICKTRQSRAHH